MVINSSSLRNDSLKADLDDLSLPTQIALYCIKKHSGIKKLRLQKIAFLINNIFLCDKPNINKDAEPYHFGMFMEDLSEELREMSEEGVLYEKNNGYVLTRYGNDLVELYINDLPKISELFDILKNLSDIEIIKIMYELFPEYTDKSKIKEKIPRFLPNLHIHTFEVKDIGSSGKKINIGGKDIVITN